MTKRAENAEATRTRILDATRTLLDSGQFHDTTMEHLAERAGVTRATLYRTFGTKQALLQGLTWRELGRASIDRVDAARRHSDPREAVRGLIRENCRMFSELGDGLPLSLELARHDRDVAAIVDATYHGRRHSSMDELGARIVQADLHAPGWTRRTIADALLVLTSHEAYDTLTTRRGRSPKAAAHTLTALATAFLRDVPR